VVEKISQQSHFAFRRAAVTHQPAHQALAVGADGVGGDGDGRVGPKRYHIAHLNNPNTAMPTKAQEPKAKAAEMSWMESMKAMARNFWT